MIKSVKVIKDYRPKIYFHIKNDISKKDIKDMTFFILDVVNGKADIKNSYITIYYEFMDNDLKEIEQFVLEIISEIGEVIREDYEDVLISWVPKFEVIEKEIDMDSKRACYKFYLKWLISEISHREE